MKPDQSPAPPDEGDAPAAVAADTPITIDPGQREMFLFRFEAGLREVVTRLAVGNALERFLRGDLTVVFNHEGFHVLHRPVLLPDGPPPPPAERAPGMYL